MNGLPRRVMNGLPRGLAYLRNVYFSRCCEQGWREYTRWDDGEWVRADPGKKTDGPHYNAFIADPFLFHHQGTNWLFYETVGPEWVASGLKGKIGCFMERVHTYNEISVNGRRLSVFDCQWKTRHPLGVMIEKLTKYLMQGCIINKYFNRHICVAVNRGYAQQSVSSTNQET